MVVAMALIEVSQYILLIIALIAAIFSDLTFPLQYVQPIASLMILALIVLSIPLNINWSRNLYGKILQRGFIFQVVGILLYAINYHSSGKFNIGSLGVSDSIYFSCITWATVGYGDIAPLESTRMITALEAFTGILSMPILASIVWMYCSDRIKSKSLDSENQTKFELQLNNDLGVFEERDNEMRRLGEEKRKSIKLNQCVCGSNNITIKKYYDVIGRTMPLAQFIVKCDNCGRLTKNTINAYISAFLWNRKNPNAKI